MTEIIPAITTPPNLNVVSERLRQLLGAHVKKVQLDIADGQYAPSKSWPFTRETRDDIVRMIRDGEFLPYAKDFLLEIDMLVLHPVEHLMDLISVGAKSFVIHVDSTDHVRICLETIKNSGCLAGLGIRPSIDVDLLEPFLTQIDFVQFMGNDKVGYSGTDFDKSVINKIKYFKDKHYSMPIQIDIGVSTETVPKLKEVGVTGFVSGSAIWNSKNVKEEITKLKSL